MSTPRLVEDFYSRIWNQGDLAANSDLLSTQFCFRGRLALSCAVWMPSGTTSSRCELPLFRLDGDLIAELWVLGDLVGLDAVLQVNAKAI